MLLLNPSRTLRSYFALQRSGNQGRADMLQIRRAVARPAILLCQDIRWVWRRPFGDNIQQFPLETLHCPNSINRTDMIINALTGSSSDPDDFLPDHAQRRQDLAHIPILSFNITPSFNDDTPTLYFGFLSFEAEVKTGLVSPSSCSPSRRGGLKAVDASYRHHIDITEGHKYLSGFMLSITQPDLIASPDEISFRRPCVTFKDAFVEGSYRGGGRIKR